MLDEILKEEDISLFNKIINKINSICYVDIESRLNFLDSKNILELLIASNPTSSLQFATLGYWYIINAPVDEALEKGTFFYKKAIEIEKNNDNEVTEQLEQKYYLELASFYCKRLNKPENALEYISEGIGKHTRFQKEFEILISEFNLRNHFIQEDTTSQVAISKEEEQISEDVSEVTEDK
jgi:hypothetical protein